MPSMRYNEIDIDIRFKATFIDVWVSNRKKVKKKWICGELLICDKRRTSGYTVVGLFERKMLHMSNKIIIRWKISMSLWLIGIVTILKEFYNSY